MNSILFWINLIIVLLWPLSFIMVLNSNNKLTLTSLISVIYVMYGWIFSLGALITLIVDYLITSFSASSNANKRRSNNQELEGGRRRK